jgi:hypothetical protein
VFDRVKSVFITAFIVGAALSCPAAAADDPKLDAPPPSLSPTTARLADILAAHDKAVGSVPHGMVDSVLQQWKFVDSGLAGTETLQRLGTDYRSSIAQGPFIEQFGQVSGKRWHQDLNGFITATTAVDERSFYAVRVLEDAVDPKNDVTVLGITSGEHPAYVLQVKRPGYRHPEWFFYEKDSGQIVRHEFVVDKHRLIQTYDDYRTTDGITTAWHVHDTDGRPELDDDYTLQSVKHGLSFTADTFAPPHQNSAASSVAQQAEIPAKTHGRGFVVRMMFNGRGYDFLLDSGASISRIDWGVAKQMGLPTFGQATQLKDGGHVSYRTVVADADVGPVHLHNMVFETTNFDYEPDDQTQVVGTLGYDFFASNVIRFDFYNGRLTVFPPSYASTNPIEGSLVVPVDIDDGTPFVTMHIGKTTAAHSIVETSMPYTMLFGALVDEEGLAIEDVDHPHAAHQHSVVPFADDGTYGIQAEVWLAYAKSFAFAMASYPQTGVIATNIPLVIHDQNVDAMIGLSHLAYYDVYFDYPNARLIVKPNEAFFKVFRKNP